MPRPSILALYSAFFLTALGSFSLRAQTPAAAASLKTVVPQSLLDILESHLDLTYTRYATAPNSPLSRKLSLPKVT